jgi:hypothetical protein
MRMLGVVTAVHVQQSVIMHAGGRAWPCADVNLALSGHTCTTLLALLQADAWPWQAGGPPAHACSLSVHVHERSYEPCLRAAVPTTAPLLSSTHHSPPSPFPVMPLFLHM